MEIPKDWWIPINDDERWIQQQMQDYEQQEYEERQQALRESAKIEREWVQLELDLGDCNVRSNPF